MTSPLSTRNSATPWLSDDEQHLWRDWLNLNARLNASINRSLQRRHDLSLSDFSVLVVLSEAPESRVRIAALADELQWERSRLSHHLTRMEKRNLVAREECLTDGRGAFVTLKPEGLSSIQSAAPDHVRLVRSIFFDGQRPEDLRAVGDMLHRMLANFEEVADEVE